MSPRPKPSFNELKKITPAIHLVQPGAGLGFITLVAQVHAVMCPRRHGLDELTTCGWDIAQKQDVQKWTAVAVKLLKLGGDYKVVHEFLDEVYPL